MEKTTFIIIWIFLFLGCSQNSLKNDVKINKTKKIERQNNSKITFESLYMGNPAISNKEMIDNINKNCTYIEPYVEQSEKWKQKCPAFKINEVYFSELKRIKQTKGEFREFTLLVKKHEQTEKYFDHFVGSEQEINTLELALFTLKDKKKIDSLNIYVHKNSIWGNADKIYYLNENNIWTLELDTDVEDGISADNWHLFSINPITGKFEQIK
jgi:hypothetical protein